VVLKSKLVVYYEVMTSLSTVAVYKFTPAFIWPIQPIVDSRHYVYEVKFNKWRSQSWLHIDRSSL